MGLDVSVYLLIGVPLLKLGSIQEDGKSIQPVNALGKPRGRPVTLRNIYLVAKNGEAFFIGSNEDSIADRDRDESEFHYSELFNSDDESDNWIWQSDYEGGPKQVIIGRALKPIETPEEYKRYEAHKIVEIDEIEKARADVATRLEERFGYSGKIYIIAHVSYSY